jgi:hypothetical protein
MKMAVLVLVWLLAIASCIAAAFRPNMDCATADKTWIGNLMIGCPEK